MKTAFLGLGVMGFPMAGHLKKGGHEVTVYNRTAGQGAEMDRDPWRPRRRNPGRGRQGRRHRVLLRRQ